MIRADADAYLLERLRGLLLADPLLREQGLDIDVGKGQVIVRGEVATPERRSAVLNLVVINAPQHQVIDDMRVSQMTTMSEPERM